ncbi:MAG: AAA family ATPase [Planctomycetota bacterium]
MTAAASPTPLHILELCVENLKRLRAVHITPDGDLVVLSGQNGAGKSSVLDAIAMALGGREQIPAEPIRRGADHAEVVVDLGEIIVRRTFTASGGGQLVVSNREGARFQSPQSMLDALVGRLSFDPLAFSREKPARQAVILRELVGLDLAPLAAKRAELYAERTAVNKRAASLRARFEAMPKHEAPAEPVDVGELAEQLKAAQLQNQENARQRAALASARDNLATRKARVANLRAELARAEEAARSSAEAVQNLEGVTSKLQDVDTSALLERIRGAESTNRLVRENHQREAIVAEQAVAASQADALTQEIEAVDQRKAEAISAARMLVPGLGLGADGVVTLNGLPLDQASAAERLRVSVAIGLAMNPRLRVLLIRDASLLDRESMRQVAVLAKEAGAQLWVERVEVDDQTTVLIEDGQVAGGASVPPVAAAG